MDEALAAELDAIKGRWLIGSPALPLAPAAWRGAVGSGEGAEVRLLVLAGQATRLCLRPVPPSPLVARPDLPPLGLPTLTGAARARLRRVLAALKQDRAGTAAVLGLLAARGRAVHPQDWFPVGAGEEVPPLYHPWLDWREGWAGHPPSTALDGASWDDRTGVSRAAALERLRALDPGAARDLLAAKLAGEKPEERERLVNALGVGLSADDAPFLEGLSESDRAPRVHHAARRLLGRLGLWNGEPEAVQAALGMMEVASEGLLRRRKLVRVKPPVERRALARLESLVGAAALAEVARALGMSQGELAASWHPSLARFVAGAAALTGAPGVLRAVFERALANGTADDPVLHRLTGRLTRKERAGLLGEAVRVGDDAFALAAALAAPEALGSVPRDAVERSASFARLVEALKAEVAGPNAGAGPRARVDTGTALRNLGLLADADAAAWLIDASGALGVAPLDERLLLLNLNASTAGEHRP